ncbi:MAG: hypothetical protein WCF23_19215 [Candidatus Nitrosopolaris sp.]
MDKKIHPKMYEELKTMKVAWAIVALLSSVVVYYVGTFALNALADDCLDCTPTDDGGGGTPDGGTPAPDPPSGGTPTDGTPSPDNTNGGTCQSGCHYGDGGTWDGGSFHWPFPIPHRPLPPAKTPCC